MSIWDISPYWKLLALGLKSPLGYIIQNPNSTEGKCKKQFKKEHHG